MEDLGELDPNERLMRNMGSTDEQLLESRESIKTVNKSVATKSAVLECLDRQILYLAQRALFNKDTKPEACFERIDDIDKLKSKIRDIDSMYFLKPTKEFDNILNEFIDMYKVVQ